MVRPPLPGAAQRPLAGRHVATPTLLHIRPRPRLRLRLRMHLRLHLQLRLQHMTRPRASLYQSRQSSRHLRALATDHGPQARGHGPRVAVTVTGHGRLHLLLSPRPSHQPTLASPRFPSRLPRMLLLYAPRLTPLGLTPHIAGTRPRSIPIRRSPPASPRPHAAMLPRRRSRTTPLPLPPRWRLPVCQLSPALSPYLMPQTNTLPLNSPVIQILLPSKSHHHRSSILASSTRGEDFGR